jgi:hypothetical protein
MGFDNIATFLGALARQPNWSTITCSDKGAEMARLFKIKKLSIKTIKLRALAFKIFLLSFVVV